MLKSKLSHSVRGYTLNASPSLMNVSLFVAVVAAGIGLGLVLNSAHAMGARSAEAFAHKAAVGNEFEVESSQLALQKSQNQNVKDFAQQMIDDHGKAADDLARATSNAGIQSPDMTLDKKHQKILDSLNAASGKDFDKRYIKAQVQAHDDAVSLFKSYSKHGDKDAVKNFAVDTLPTLEEHKQKIDQLKSSY